MLEKMSDLYRELEPFDESTNPFDEARRLNAIVIALVLKMGGDVTLPALELSELVKPRAKLHTWTDHMLNLRLVVDQ